MSKIICDICGTTYQDTADACPICGCPRDIAAQLAKEDFLLEDIPGEPTSKRKEIFDYDEVNLPAAEKKSKQREHLEEEEEDQEEPEQNTGVVILLTVLIVVLLAAMGFLYWKFLRPDNTPEQTHPAPVYTTQAPTEAPTTEEPETTEMTIPCQSLALSSGNAELSHEGQAFLLNVVKVPEDTTDELIFTSEDPAIATVDESGRIVAVAQGETVVTILCGDQKLTCPVICAFETDEGETVPETQETTEATEENLKNVTLKLKRSDISLPVYTYFTLALDCDLTPEEVQWTSEHPYIATVDEKGMVTAIKSGITQINAQYGDQTVSCIVRCTK